MGGQMKDNPWHQWSTPQCVQIGISIINLGIAVAIVITLMVTGITIKDKADTYMRAMDLTPERTGVMMERTFGIVDNVHSVTSNMVPLSEATVEMMTDNSTTPSNISMSQAATEMIASLSSANWGGFVANASNALGSASALNFTVVTDFVRQVSDPSFQGVVKEQIRHALGSFDFAASGAGNFFQTLKNGIISQTTEDKSKTSSENHQA